MKIGMRTPSPTRSIKARTTGRVKRAAKKSINPVYGQKGVGYITDPERAVKNKIYHKVTYDPLQSIKEEKWPEQETRSSFSVYRFFMVVLSIVAILLAFFCVYKLIAYKELHVIPATLVVACFILLTALKYNEN